VNRFVSAGARAADRIGAALVAGILLAVVAGVARRYLFGAPIVWIDELTSVLFVWAVFWTAALVIPLRDHVAFELVDGAVPPGVRRWVGVVAAVAAALTLGAAAPKIIDFILFLWRERTPALQWRLDFVFACFGLFVVAMAVRLLLRAARLCSRGWRDELDPPIS
jgi:TRAP-type C4-dicarboxylate transport system permease small subunit